MNYFDLQLFAEEPAAEPEDKQGSEITGQPQPKYTDADLDKILSGKYAKWASEQNDKIEAARKEGEKLAKMNADQKKAYELEQANKKAEELTRQIEQLQAEKARVELEKSAAKILKEEHGIASDEAILGFVVGSDAETTKNNIETMAKLLEAARKEGEKNWATGKTPLSTSSKETAADPILARAAAIRNRK